MRTSGSDRFFGHRIKGLRQRLGVTQRQLAERIGISCQQLSRYENGLNRLSASRLLAFLQALDVAVADLFDGYDGARAPLDPAVDLAKSQILLNLMKAFRAVEPKNSEAMARLVQALGTHRSPASRSEADHS